MRRPALLNTFAAICVLTTGWHGTSASAYAEDIRRHAMSLVNAPRYAADFKSFDWVNPDAPKGGRFRQYALGSFDTLNQFPRDGQAAGGLGLIYEHLFASSPDEAATGYALIAEWASYPVDFSSATFGLREAARFQDGKPITPEDVIFSLDALKKASPFYMSYYKHVVKAEKIGPREVRFTFDSRDNRELPQIISEIPVLPKHWWEGKNDKGEARDVGKSMLEPPLGSGPYKIKSFDAGRSITYERVKDWWAADLPVAKGQWNFDELQITYYSDRTAPFEAFKIGTLDYWAESSAKAWATNFEFDAVKRGWVKPESFPVKRVASMQGYVMNLRRPQFQDVRVRRAINLAFNFEEANKNLFYGQYKRLNSYFDNSELASRGLPEGREQEILNEVKPDLPPEVLTAEWKSPVYATQVDERINLSAASKLLAEAGYKNQGGVLVNAAGTPLAFEFLIDDPSLQRTVQPFEQSLKKLGIQLRLRVVDSAQYQRRLTDFDYDMISDQFPQSESPGNEQRDFFGSSSADVKGAKNSIGIKNKAIDAIIEKIIFARDRTDLVAATRALDRTLLWNFYVVPNWYSGAERIATWDRFGRPKAGPSRTTSVLQTWWVDPDKAKALAAARGQ